MTAMKLWFLPAVVVAMACVAGGSFAAASGTAPLLKAPLPSGPRPALMPVLPQNDVLPANLAAIAKDRENIVSVLVVIEMGHGEDNPRWVMGQTQMQVFLSKLIDSAKRNAGPEDFIWPQLPRLSQQYRGVRILLQRADGKRFAPFMIFEGKVTAPNLSLVVRDYGRQMEYFIYGTARVRRDQMLGVGVLPVFSFEQCRLMGQKIRDTTPRQCLLPDNNIMLETQDKPTLVAARMKTFNDCLQNGKALIYTFPRRCLAAGGRVLTEPPQVYEAEMAAKAAKEAKAAQKAALVEAIPQNTAVGGKLMGPEAAGLPSATAMPMLGASASVNPLAEHGISTAVAMPSPVSPAAPAFPALAPRVVSPSVFPPMVPHAVSPAVAAPVKAATPTVVPVKDAIAAAKSVLAPVSKSFKSVLPAHALGE